MDAERANAARMYDFHLGGSHHFEVDRVAARGGVHVLSHATADHDPDAVAQASVTYRGTDNPITPRAHDEVTAMLGGLELAEPGLVDATAWRPDRGAAREHAGYWAAVAPLPATPSR